MRQVAVDWRTERRGSRADAGAQGRRRARRALLDISRMHQVDLQPHRLVKAFHFKTRVFDCDVGLALNLGLFTGL